MMRPVAVCFPVVLGALLLAASARAEDLPLRKPGLWEMKIVKEGSGLPGLTTQQCTDASTDRDMNNTVSPMGKETGAKTDVQKTATGYSVDAACSMAGGTMTSHSDVTGDFNSA